ncbi:MAG TPA: fumarylacetoacetase [Hyphomicrobiaceae bacterium]|nr:fumarylacetoacetase [Hyphomicrobiaceae bacterium]
MALNETHDPALKSWVASANVPGCPFPIQNLPFCIFSAPGRTRRMGVGIGDQILDLSATFEAGHLRAGHIGAEIFPQPSLNAFMATGRTIWREMRGHISRFLDARNPADKTIDRALHEKILVPMSAASLHLPIEVRSFTDFYASKEHATNVGAMFRGPENALMPNWLHIPIGYNGRASTVVVSGTDIRRPLGQTKAPDAAMPSFGPCKRLDFELELGAIVGTGNRMGEPVTVAEAYDMIFGYVLLNDWSARDIQAWEYQPLGPFQSKAFATSISPWVVTAEALEPFRVATPERVKPLLPYLVERGANNFDLKLEVALTPAGSNRPTTISRTNYKGMYYSAAQQLAHHAVGGCEMCTGDLLGSGTISGPTKDSLGSLVEITWGGKEPLGLEGGAKRTFLEDGDELVLTGHCEKDGVRIGFGECRGKVLPAPKEREWG